jgi:NADP-dependent 3-hydroxy acid dehydrogenase YdfG
MGNGPSRHRALTTNEHRERTGRQARVLITGGTSGLEAAMATALLDAGATVAVTGRDAARAEVAARNLGRGAIGVGMDVREEARSSGEWAGPSRTLAVSKLEH